MVLYVPSRLQTPSLTSHNVLKCVYKIPEYSGIFARIIQNVP